MSKNASSTQLKKTDAPETLITKATNINNSIATQELLANGDMAGDSFLTQKLLELRDSEYAAFQQKITPNVAPETFIGIRLPDIRKLAKQYKNTDESRAFMQQLPHQYYDENMLHGILASEIKKFDECVAAMEEFFPYIDNWAVCDSTKPKVFEKHKEELKVKIREWSFSDHTYTCRFGIEMIMNHFLDDDFDPELLDIPAQVHSDEYYVQMMQAWFYATALAKQWDATIPYITKNRLDTWVHNKTIQKARESYRITAEQKEYLKSLKR